MSFLFPSKEAKTNHQPPAPAQQQYPLPPAHSSPSPADERVMMSTSPPITIDAPESPSTSSQGPVFHNSFTPTSTSSLSGSSSFGVGAPMAKLGTDDYERASAGNTPPASADLTRNTSTSSTGSHSAGGGSAPMPILHSSSTSSSHLAHPSTSSSMLIPPHATGGSHYGMMTKVGSSGSIHNIYHTNVVMTPASSHPSTPNAHHAQSYSSHSGLGALPGMDLDAMPTRATSQSVTNTPSRSINASPGLPLIQIQQQPAPLLFPPPQTRPAALSVPNLTVSTSDPSASITHTTAGGGGDFVPDEVSRLRTMFRAVPQLGRSTFALGDTLGTGTFGRVRVVSYQPPNTATTPPAAAAATSGLFPPITPQTALRRLTPTSTAAQPAAAQLINQLPNPHSRPLHFALKMLKKSEIIRLKQVEHIKAEKAILSRINHPFIVNLYAAFQDERYLYLTLEFVLGGELFSQLRKVGRFSNETGRFYAAEIVLALQYLHSKAIIYRDLKPENLLIDSEGHIKITDFGFAKDIGVDGRTWTLCGTPEYLAPEIIQSKGHGKAVDWWALGILIFEMLAGYPPFYDENPFGIYQKVLKGSIDFPKHMSPEAKDLIKKLLTADRTKRFGCLQHGAEDIKRHPWFRNLDWDKLLQRKYKPPFVPAYRAPNDTSNFDRYPDSREGAKIVELTDKEKALFQDF